MDVALVDGWAIFFFWTKLSIGFSELILEHSRFLRFSVTKFHKNFRFLIIIFLYHFAVDFRFKGLHKFSTICVDFIVTFQVCPLCSITIQHVVHHINT